MDKHKMTTTAFASISPVNLVQYTLLRCMYWDSEVCSLKGEVKAVLEVKWEDPAWLDCPMGKNVEVVVDPAVPHCPLGNCPWVDKGIMGKVDKACLMNNKYISNTIKYLPLLIMKTMFKTFPLYLEIPSIYPTFRPLLK